MNLEITMLAETMDVTTFTNELDNRNIHWMFEECDNIMDPNDGDCLITVEDMMYSFSDGKLDYVSEIIF